MIKAKPGDELSGKSLTNPSVQFLFRRGHLGFAFEGPDGELLALFFDQDHAEKFFSTFLKALEKATVK